MAILHPQTFSPQIISSQIFSPQIISPQIISPILPSNVSSRPHYSSIDCPNFKEGDIVEVDLSYFGPRDEGENSIVEAVVVGMLNNDSWILQFDQDFFGTGFKTIIMVSHGILKEEKLNWDNY
jgi:hypothetical protein